MLHRPGRTSGRPPAGARRLTRPTVPMGAGGAVRRRHGRHSAQTPRPPAGAFRQAGERSDGDGEPGVLITVPLSPREHRPATGLLCTGRPDEAHRDRHRSVGGRGGRAGCIRRSLRGLLDRSSPASRRCGRAPQAPPLRPLRTSTPRARPVRGVFRNRSHGRPRQYGATSARRCGTVLDDGQRLCSGESVLILRLETSGAHTCPGSNNVTSHIPPCVDTAIAGRRGVATESRGAHSTTPFLPPNIPSDSIDSSHEISCRIMPHRPG